MEKDNHVSIWVGYSPTIERIEKYILIPYSEDGDQLGSQFSHQYHINSGGFIDEDFLELSCFGPVNNILKGMECSYYEYVSEQIERAEKQFVDWRINFAILYFNYDYSGAVTESHLDDISTKFIGGFPYR